MATIHRTINNSAPVHTNLSHFQQEPDLMSHTNNFNSLPKQFVTSMRTLFEIMDEKRTGYIKLIDIENRWQDDQSKDVPRGLVECLRNVTPPNGLLSFERFCIGLKICLVNNQIGNGSSSMSNENGNNQRSPSAPLLDLDNQPTKPHWNNTATVRPNNAALQTQQRTLSLPQLSPDSDSDLIVEPIPQIPGLYGPPKPPRTSLENKSNGMISNNHQNIPNNNVSNSLDKIEIRNALQNWQIGVLKNSVGNGNVGNNHIANNNIETQFLTRPLNRGLGDGETAEVMISSGSNGNIQSQKKPTNRKREPRRHTLQNGIDYNMMKRLKQYEQEKEVLMEGLSAIERTREWYLKQIANVQEKMRYLGRMGSHIVSHILFSILLLAFFFNFLNEINWDYNRLSEELSG